MSSYQSDILATGLKTVFCGINPAESAERAGHNFSTPSTRFWTVLHLSGFTPERLRPQDVAARKTAVMEKLQERLKSRSG